jgi:ATP-dependent Zn protease
VFDLLTTHKENMVHVAELLLKKEVLYEEDFKELLNSQKG